MQASPAANGTETAGHCRWRQRQPASAGKARNDGEERACQTVLCAPRILYRQRRHDRLRGLSAAAGGTAGRSDHSVSPTLAAGYPGLYLKAMLAPTDQLADIAAVSQQQQQTGQTDRPDQFRQQQVAEQWCQQSGGDGCQG